MQTQEELQEIKSITDTAIDSGFGNADRSWKYYAYETLKNIARKNNSLTVNDLKIGLKDCPYQTHDKRALGGILVKGKRNGIIKPSGDTIRSKDGHGIRVQIWKSLIYKPNLFN